MFLQTKFEMSLHFQQFTANLFQEWRFPLGNGSWNLKFGGQNDKLITEDCAEKKQQRFRLMS